MSLLRSFFTLAVSFVLSMFSYNAYAQSCLQEGILLQGAGNIQLINMLSGSFIPITSSPAQALNPVAFNEKDNLVYGKASGNSDTIRTITIGGTYPTYTATTTTLGSAGMTIEQGAVAGDIIYDPTNALGFGEEASFYIVNTNLQAYEVVDVDPASGTYISTLRNVALRDDGTGTFDGTGTGANIPDVVYYSGTQKLYGLNASGNSANYQLFEIDPTNVTPSSGNPNIVASTTNPNVGTNTGSFGAGYIDPNGFAYFSNNSSGDIYRFDLNAADPASTSTFFASTGSTTSGNDGARCASAPVEILAADDSATTPEATLVVIDAQDNDSYYFTDSTTNTTCANGSSGCTGPSNGTLVNNGDGTFNYTPNGGFSGTDSFVYEICDSETPQNCDTATVTITVTAVASPDYGDAPSTYTVASTTIDTDIYLGSVAPDSDTGNAEDGTDDSGNAQDDDTNDAYPTGFTTGADEEDGATFNLLEMTDSSYTVPVSVTNNSTGAVYVTGWIDFDQDGAFDETTEHSNEITVAASSGMTSVSLSFTVPGDTLAGPTFARIIVTDTPGTTSTAGGTGEVEDTFINIAETDVCSVTAGSGLSGFEFVDFTPTGTTDNPKTFSNVAVAADGTPVDVVATLTINTGSLLTFGNGVPSPSVPDEALFTTLAGAGTVQDAVLSMAFVMAGTSTPVNMNAGFSANDIDGAATYFESVGFDTSVFGAFATSNPTTLVPSVNSPYQVYQGTVAASNSPAGAVYAAFNNQSSISISLHTENNAGVSGAGYFFIGNNVLSQFNSIQCDAVLPAAVDDTASTSAGTLVAIDVADNDDSSFDTTTTNNTCTTCTNPTNGTVTNNGDGTFDYTPYGGFTGTDTFIYEICETGPTNCDTAEVTITVNALPYTPIAAPACPAGEELKDYLPWNSTTPLFAEVLSSTPVPNVQALQYTHPNQGVLNFQTTLDDGAGNGEAAATLLATGLLLRGTVTTTLGLGDTYTLDLGLPTAVDDVRFVISDIDGASVSGKHDGVTVIGFNGATSVTPNMIAQGASFISIGLNGDGSVSATTDGTANLNATNPNSRVDVYFDQPIDRILVTRFETGTPNAVGGLFVEDIERCEISTVTGTVDITDTSVPGDTLTVTVEDADLNTNTGVAETVVVTVVNDVTGESENVTLTETGVDTGIFVGTVNTTFGTTAGTNNDGTFNTQATDIVTVTYNDAATATGGTASPTDTNTVGGGTNGTVDITATSIPGDTLTITVEDADLNTNTGVAETVTVTAVNPVTGESEDVILTETGPNTGVFTNTVATTFGTTAGTDNDGTFNTQDMDTITVTYNDALTSTGGTASPTDTDTVGGGTDGAVDITDNSVPGDTLTVTVDDADLNTDAGVAETVVVTVVNDVTGESEDVTLTETGPNTGVFEGTVDTTFGTTAGTDNDGTFNTQDMDTVTVTYNDALTSVGSMVSLTDANTVIAALDDTASTSASTPVDIDVTANDSNSFDVTTVNVDCTNGSTGCANPTNGTVSIDPATGEVTYTPNDGFSGTDTFTYEICDTGGANCDTATVTVTVSPEASDDSAVTPPETAVTVDVADNDTSSLDPTTVNTTCANGSAGCLNPTNGTISIDPTTGEITYTPDPGFSGDDTFIYEICEPGPVNCVTATVTVAVAVEAMDDTASTNAETPVTIDVVDNDSSSLDPTTVNTDCTNGSTGCTNPTNGTVSIDPVTGEVTYTPNDGFSGTDTFAYEICEAGGTNCDTATVTITVAPEANDDTEVTPAGIPTVVDVVSNDSSSLDPTTVNTSCSTCTTPTNGTISIDPVTGEVTYTPDDEFMGTDTFTYEICEPGPVNCVTATVTVEVVNNPPVAEDDSTSTPQDTAVSIPVLVNDSDPDGDPLTVGVLTNPTNGTVTVTPDGEVIYTPTTGFTGTDTFTYEVCDSNGVCDPATITVDVNTDIPTATTDTVVTPADEPVTTNVLTNDTDPSDDPLTINTTPVTEPMNGTVTINTDGTVTYTPNSGFTGTDMFEYEICDPDGNCDTAIVSITIDETTPDATADVDSTAPETPVTISVLDNDNLAGLGVGVLGIAAVTQAANGEVVINADGTVTYTPDVGFVGVDTLYVSSL